MKYKGQLKDFPPEVVEKMLERQVEQGNPRCVEAFEEDVNAGSLARGFAWHRTPEGNPFWDDVIVYKKFDMFFEKYPKQEMKEEQEVKPYPKVMEVSVYLTFPALKTYKRVVFMEKNGRFLSWASAETLEEAKEAIHVHTWDYARDIEEPKIFEVTMKEIAEKFGVEVEKLRIKE